MQKASNKIIDISPLLNLIGMQSAEFKIVETPAMYSYKQKLEDNWAYYSAFGFQALKKILEKDNLSVKNMAIVGIGSGVEGIEALEVFPKLQNLVISDIDQEILVGAVKNILPAAGKTNLRSFIGSFAEPMQTLPYKFDVIHGNIPNLPSKENQDLSLGAEKGTFLPTITYEAYRPPLKFTRWAMAAQYAYLQSAKKAIAPGGLVLTELGGRMPLERVLELFNQCRLKAQEIIAGFKEQTEGLIDFQGYHEIEQQYGMEFDFYLYKKSKALMRKKGISNPSTQISGQELKNLLLPYRVNAAQALGLFHKGIAVGHTVHIFMGTNL